MRRKTFFALQGLRAVVWLGAALLLMMPQRLPAREKEQLDRGVVASRVNSSASQALVSWRLLDTDPADIAFNVYRSAGGGTPVKLNDQPVTKTTSFMDRTVNFGVKNVYTVRSVRQGVEQPQPGQFVLMKNPLKMHFRIPVDPVKSPSSSYSYSITDCAAGDLDGDGAYEIVARWDPSNAKDNSQDGVTGRVFLDAYKLDGTKLWRIDLGPNIRAGAHYTQMVVYDLDGDGRAEVAVRTSEGTVFGDGVQIGDTDHDGVTNYVASNGRILAGPEFISVIEGTTGRELARADYIPRGPKSEWKKEWGDDYGNRIDRFLAGMGYFNGETPSLLICRGYYGKTVLEAWDFRQGKLTRRWNFTADSSHHSSYRGQGNHNLVVGDVDGDGLDEVTFGACAIDHDGTPLYNTRLGHGDAMHLSDMDPRRPGLEVWQVHESTSATYGSELRDAATGAILYGLFAGDDVGRGCAADIDPSSPGFELWSSRSGGLLSIDGKVLKTSPPSMMNFASYWSGTLDRDLMDGTSILNYRRGAEVLNAGSFSAKSVNGSKSNPSLSADLLGDWREEAVYPSKDNKYLLVFVSPYETDYRFVCLMQDPLYRSAVVTQNVAYNQPPHLSWYLGPDLGRLIQEREVALYGDEYLADAGYDYDSVVWSTGATGRKALLKASAFDVKEKFTADIYYKGSWFRDSVYVTFKSWAPQMVRQPQLPEQPVCEGGEVQLSAEAAPVGGRPVDGWQWYLDGEPLPDGNQPACTATRSGVYHVVVRSTPFETASEPVTVAFAPYPVLTAQPAGGRICLGDEWLLQVAADHATSYVWFKDNRGLSDVRTASWKTEESGVYRAAVFNGTCMTMSQSAKVVVHPLPTVSLAVRHVNLLAATASDAQSTYAWYLDKKWLSAGPAATYRALQSGEYRVEVTDRNGCRALSDTCVLRQVTPSPGDLTPSGVQLYPNPVQDVLTVRWPQPLQRATIRIVTLTGGMVRQEEVSGRTQLRLDLSGWPAGCYLLTLEGDGRTETFRFMKD